MPIQQNLTPETTNPIIDILPEQQDVEDFAGASRLGLYPCKLEKGTIASEAYGEEAYI